jgi:hypothetical protein
LIAPIQVPPPVLVEVWPPCKCDAEARRLAREWSRLAERPHDSRDDEDALWSLLAHANSLLDYMAASPVQSAATAAALMRHLLDEVDEPEGLGSGLNSCAVDDVHLRGLGRVLEWLEAQAAREEGRAR